MIGAPVTGRLLSRQFTRELARSFDGRLGERMLPAIARRLGRWQASAEASLGPASGLTAIYDVGARPLFAIFGFVLTRVGGSHDDHLLSVASAAGTGALPVVIGHWTDRLDALTRRAVQEAIARRARWAFCFNGRGLRLIDADRPFARRFLEIDLAAAARDAAATRIWWAACRSGAFAERPAAARDASIGELVQASDAHAGRTADALQRGVHAALHELAHSMRRRASPRRAPAPAIVEDALTVIYRLLFLLYAEARALVPMWNPLYRHSYSVDGLREACDRPAEAIGLWPALQAISRLAHEGCTTEALRVTAFNGQLFSPASAPLAERLDVDDGAIGRVIRALTDVPSTAGVSRIAYADLGVEQLGTIYERVLDYAPDLEATLAHPHAAGRAAAAPVAPQGDRHPSPSPRPQARLVVSARRKESGTFYTPRPMAEYLVRATLAPLVRDATAAAILRLRVVDPAMGSGAFLVAACRFLADAYGQALEREGQLARGDASPAQRAGFRRLIAQRCLYGVDLNPVAVQLARLSLWLVTLAAEAPLTFLDHHLCVGDSLVGASTEDLLRGWSHGAGRRPSRRGDRLPLFDGEIVTDAIGGLMPMRLRLARPDRSAADVRDKEAALARSRIEGSLARLLQLADAWCARWFWPSPSSPPPRTAWHEIGDFVVGGASALPAPISAGWLGCVREAAAQQRFLHWSLQFPEVFFDEHGTPRADAGFDAVIGNPPWDMVRADARDAPQRDASRRASMAMSHFVRESGHYVAGGEAQFNRYQLFVERAVALTRHGGRLGLIVPWGLAGDVAGAALRRRLFDRCDIDSIVAFDNVDGLFPIHRRIRFLLITASTGAPTTRVRCRLGERSLDALERLTAGATPSETGVMLTPSWLRRVSGEGLEVPYVRGARDVALLDALHARHPAVSSPDGWGAAFGRELNATDDRHLFAAGGDGIPIVAGKDLVPFATIVADAAPVVAARHADQLLQRLPSIARRRLAYRDVAAATNRVTLIAALLPARVVSTHTLFCLKSALDEASQYCLCALLNSLVANYLMRLRVTTHVTVALVSRLPVPQPRRGGAAFQELVHHARALEDVARATAGVGRGRDPAQVERLPAWARLQAIAAQAYGLDRDELDHVLSTFPLVDPDAIVAARAAFVRL